MIELKSKDIQMVEPKILKNHPLNPHKHSAKQIERLMKLIEYQGFRNPIVVEDGTNLVVAGHGRLQAAKKLKMKKIPVTYQKFEDDDQLIAYMISDNAIGKDNWADLDMSVVNEQLEKFGEGFDFDMLGLNETIVSPYARSNPEKDAIQDDVPEHVEPRAKPGDVWVLGEHRLMCGDSTNVQHVEKLMNGEKADMVFTDPPYPNNSKIMHDMIMNIDVAFKNSRNFCKGLMLWFWDNLETPPFFEKITSKHIWHKINGWQAGHFESLYCYHGDNKRHEQYVFSEISVGGENIRQIQGNHPTPKPIKLCETIFEKLNFEKTILDMFGGSGSTLIACEKTNRKCFMMEIDPHYCDVIIER